MTNKEADKMARKAAAVVSLRELCPKGTTVYTILKHASRSGTTRVIACVIAYTDEKGKPRVMPISGKVATALGWRWDGKRGGVVAHGGGMDMGFAVVYDLAAVLYGPAPVLNEKTGSRGKWLDHEWL